MTIQLLLAQAQLERLAVKAAYASEIHAPVYDDDADSSIRFWADTYNISYYQMRETIRCESNFNSQAVGDYGHSYGIAQIYLDAHTDVTKAQALDPDFSISWMARQFSIGKKSMWTCARILGFTDG